MTKDEEVQFLKWCNTQGLDQIVTNNKRTYLKDQPTGLDILSKPIVSVNPSREVVDKCNSLEALKLAVESFEGCSLKKTATNTVFSDGNSKAEVMVIGEAPGANEDIKGIPFCGESGQLLDKIFASIGLSRKENLYITNTVFWRPPGNRKPTEQELSMCLPFLEKHIALINPKLIVIVGSVALQALFNDALSISKQRQKKFVYKNPYLNREITAIATFHPSYLLRQPSQKRFAWQDMLFIRQILTSASN